MSKPVSKVNSSLKIVSGVAASLVLAGIVVTPFAISQVSKSAAAKEKALKQVDAIESFVNAARDANMKRLRGSAIDRKDITSEEYAELMHQNVTNWANKKWCATPDLGGVTVVGMGYNYVGVNECTTENGTDLSTAWQSAEDQNDETNALIRKEINDSFIPRVSYSVTITDPVQSAPLKAKIPSCAYVFKAGAPLLKLN